MTTAFIRIFHLPWIGLCALSMLAQTRLVFGLPLAPDLLDGYVFGSTLFAYGFTHSDRRRKRAAWLAGVGGSVCFILSAWPVSAPGTPTWPATALIPLLLWLLYYGLQRPGTAGLRGVPAAKPLVVGLTWAMVTVLLPLSPERWSDAAAVFTGRTLFIFALALAYDLGDLAYDRRHGLSTLAGLLGARGTFRLIDGALGLAAVCYGANFFLLALPPPVIIALLASLTISAWWLRRLLYQPVPSDGQKLWIDALMPLQFLLVWLSGRL